MLIQFLTAPRPFTLYRECELG